MTTTCEQWAARLAEAEAALHTLSMGGAFETIQDGENRVTFQACDLNKLQRYVRHLQRKVDRCNGAPCSGSAIIFMPTDC